MAVSTRSSSEKRKIVVIGSGWAGYELSQSLDLSRWQITVVSPLRTIQYTPLLASAACALFDFRLAEEPLKRRSRAEIQYHKAYAEDVDFGKKVVTCRPSTFEDDSGWNDKSNRTGEKDRHAFKIPYDTIVIAPGCSVQTFGTPGAEEHALFLKSVADARRIQARLLEMLDAASMPGLSDQQQREMLHIRVVGGGAIGIEATAELFDLWHDELRFLYPALDGKVNISVHDVAPNILTTFDESLAEYAVGTLKARKIEVLTGSHIERVEADAIYTKEHGRMAYGMLLWATGNKACGLVEQLDVKRPEKGMPRILTNSKLQVLRPDGRVEADAYAIGDAADIEDQSLPTLAEVALQKGEFLRWELNVSDQVRRDFKYKQRAVVAYLGKRDGIFAGRTQWTGDSAWLAWRSGTLGWTRSWRRKFMILINWMLIFFGGRDIARR